MKCYIYSCSKKKDLYVYLRDCDDFSVIPEELLKACGRLVFSMELEMTTTTKMAQENPVDVMQHLVENGFHIQLPRAQSIEEMIGQQQTLSCH